MFVQKSGPHPFIVSQSRPDARCPCWFVEHFYEGENPVSGQGYLRFFENWVSAALWIDALKRRGSLPLVIDGRFPDDCPDA